MIKRIGFALRIFISLAVFLFLAGASFISDAAEKDVSSPKETARQQLSIKEIYAKYESSVVEISTIEISDSETKYSGSGFFVSKDGEILTNNHVVRKDVDETVLTKYELEKHRNIEYYYFVKFKTTSGREKKYPAIFVGSDPRSDTALLKIETKDFLDINVAVFGDSQKTKVGEEVVAIGNPFSFERSITKGLVSQIERRVGSYDMPSFKIADVFQTDAAINPGNSGGPLINMYGEVIGIVNLKLSRGEGMAFAVPIHHPIKRMDRMKKEGKIVSGWTGMKFLEEKLVKSGNFIDFLELSEKVPFMRFIPTEDAFAIEKLIGTLGAFVVDVEKDSPAEIAGIKKMDLVVTFSDVPIYNYETFEDIIFDVPIGTVKSIEVLRVRNGEIARIGFSILIIKKDFKK